MRKDTGLEWVTPHTFRKTVATLISERVDAETASQQLGHSSPAITREFYISQRSLPMSRTSSTSWPPHLTPTPAGYLVSKWVDKPFGFT